jgi:hypothetical protein
VFAEGDGISQKRYRILIFQLNFDFIGRVCSPSRVGKGTRNPATAGSTATRCGSAAAPR